MHQPARLAAAPATMSIIRSCSTLALSISPASATPTSGRSIRSLALVYDGSTISRFEVANGNTPFTTSEGGDHVIEAFATDDLGVTGDAIPVHVRVGPPAARIRFMINSGDWSNAANWRDLQGASGAPNVNDLAIVGGSHASLSEDRTAYAVSLNGGSITGPGSLTVTGHLAIAAGELRNLNVTITDTGTLQLINDVDIRMTANLINYGTISITGTGGVLGIPAANATSVQGRAESRCLLRRFLQCDPQFWNNDLQTQKRRQDTAAAGSATRTRP